MSPTSRLALLLFIVSLAAGNASAQVVTGTPPFGSFGGGPDIINLGNLNAHLTAPALNKAGRGLAFNYNFAYDSSVWVPLTSSGTTSWQPSTATNWGWTTSIPRGGHVSYSTLQTNFLCGGGKREYVTTFLNWVYQDGFGTTHPFSKSSQTETGCTTSSTSFTSTASDGSGYTLSVTGNTINSLIASDGAIINPTTGAISLKDRNGNQVTSSTSSGTTSYYDTLSSTTAVLTVSGSGTPSSPYLFTYTTPSGAPASYTMNYTNFTVATNFGVSGISEYKSSAAVPLVTSIVLPDNSQYTFTYEATPGTCTPYSGTTCVTARLSSVALPTGGTISYSYYNTGSNNFTACTTGNNGIFSDGSTSCLQRTTPDGTWTYTRTQVSGNHWTTKITTPPDPANQGSVGNDTVIDFQKDSATNSTNNFYETQRLAYQGSSSSGTLLRTTTTCYNTNTTNCATTAVSSPISQRNVTSSIPTAGSSTLQAQHIAMYNSVGVPTEFDDYAFGSGAVGGLLRQTLITYASLGNITAFRQTVTVKNSAGTILAQTNYNYDETTPTPAPTGTPQLTSVSGSRGNPTSVQRCTNTSSCSTGYVQTTMTYDTAGQLQTVTDPLNNKTSFSYADNFFKDDGNNPPAGYTSSVPTDAYVTAVTLPTTNTLNYGYYYYSGQLAQAADQNGNKSYSHFQDIFARLTAAYGPPVPVPGSQNPASPWVLNAYASHTQGDTYLGIDDTSASASCSSCRHDQVALDGLGRTIHGYLVSDPEGQTQVDTVYDALGRVQSASHPHRSTSSTTDGIETPTYDALRRTTKVTHPNNTYSQTLYAAAVSGTGVNTTQLCSSSTYGLGFPVLAIDEASKKREFWTDALGRTIEADEPDSTGALNSNTCYSYDPLGNLLQIVHGTQTRTYGYDALSRVASVTIPELANCAVTYTYDNNSNLQTRVAPAPNQTSCTSKVTTTYFYDTLNRLTKITYSPATTPPTPTVQYGYDGVAPTGCTPPALTDSNGKGRRTSMCDGSGATSWAHDAAGRIITEKRTILGVTLTLSYSYNLDGSIATMTYPSNKVITYTVSNAQRLTSAKDLSGSVIQFATAASYAPPGGLSGMITGQISGGFGGVTESHTFNSSLEYTNTKALPPSGLAALDLTLSYSIPGGDNGTVTGITNNADTGRTQSFTYDPLNRILSAKSSATSGVDCWGQNFGPDGTVADDAVANLTKINNGTQTPPPCTFGSLNATVDPNNHINTDSTYAYDAAGNTTKDGSGTGWLYAFDAENRLTLATGPTGGPYCYIYDGFGLRVAKKSGAANDCTGGTVVKLYWRSLSGDALAETDGSGSVTNTAYAEYVFFAGRRIASRINSGNGNTLIFYYFADHLGSTRTITTGSGKNSDGSNQTPGLLCYDADFTPYGQEISYTTRLQTTACPPNYKFTGYERDSETGLDYAFARYYSSRLGRFLSTDPFGGTAGNLQSHNAYAYTQNNPLNFIDPSGMFLAPPSPDGCDLDCPGGGPDPGAFCPVFPCGPGPNLGLGDPGFGPQSGPRGGGGIWNTALLGPMPGPPPPPGFQDCLDALGEKGKFSPALLRANNNWGAIDAAASANGIDPAVLAAIGIRETGFQNITGDYGHGHGVFQIDDRYNAAQIPIAYNIPAAADFAAGFLAQTYNSYVSQGFNSTVSTAAAVRNYNASGRLTPLFAAAYRDFGDVGFMDIGTTHSDYVSNVLAIAENCFP